VHAHNRSIDYLHGRIMSCGQSIHDLVPNTSLPPANKPIVASRMGTVALGQITPWCTRSQDPKDAIKSAPVVNAGNAACFVREHRPDDTPFAVAEFISHDAKLRFWSLKS
jgi:hypothetical protein